MKVKCVHRRGMKIPDEILALGNTPDTVFDIAFGRIYIVYAIAVWTRIIPKMTARVGVIHYMILNDETFRPDWYPAALFEVVDNVLPSTWRYSYWGREPDYQVEAVWGYVELVSNKGIHYSELMEREPHALATFEKRQAEIDAEANEV